MTKKKYSLLYEFGRLVKEVHPDIVTMENASATASFKLLVVLTDFIMLLEEDKFHHTFRLKKTAEL